MNKRNVLCLDAERHSMGKRREHFATCRDVLLVRRCCLGDWSETPMMEIVELRAHGRKLCVSVAGDFTVNAAKKNFLKVIDLIEQHRSEKILFDGRGVVGVPTVIDRFYYGEFVAEAVKALVRRADFGASPQFAYILRPPVLDPQRLGETVAINRGMKVRAFDDLDKGLEWVGLPTKE